MQWCSERDRENGTKLAVAFNANKSECFKVVPGIMFLARYFLYGRRDSWGFWSPPVHLDFIFIIIDYFKHFARSSLPFRYFPNGCTLIWCIFFIHFSVFQFTEFYVYFLHLDCHLFLRWASQELPAHIPHFIVNSGSSPWLSALAGCVAFSLLASVLLLFFCLNSNVNNPASDTSVSAHPKFNVIYLKIDLQSAPAPGGLTGEQQNR